jgi:hypothetical protein
MPYLTKGIVAVGLILALIGATGCSSQSTVTGEVTVDGNPLKEGTIRFEPMDGKSQTASVSIVDGRFSVSLSPGEKRVQISAPKVVGKKKMYETPESPLVDEVVELLPDRYNARSELKMTVQSGSQQQRFELKSK